MQAVDKLRDTAESHGRLFLVEVMGRRSGYLAACTAVAALACLPEAPMDVQHLLHKIQLLKTRGKSSIMVIVAEGRKSGGALQLNEDLGQAGCPYETCVVVLGHLQRGGSPVPADRILASRLGAFALDAILDGQTGVMAGEVHDDLVLTPLPDTHNSHKTIPRHLIELLAIMSS